MKLINIGMVLCAILAFFTVSIEAQNPVEIDVEAIVVAPDGEPVEGAAVEGEDGEQAITDASGQFSLTVPLESTLTISATGFKDHSISAEPDLEEIMLESGGNEEVQVAFREVNENDLLGGISYVNIPEKMEKNYTTNSLEGMNAYVGGFHGNLWGMDEYLVMVDGIPRDAGNVVSSEIEQVTFLKGVSAVALYGSRAAKGVVHITTKRGEVDEQDIKVRANSGFHVPKRFPKYLGSAEYMTLYNEARRNDGLSESFDEETIYHHASGSNPYRYPDVDYYTSDYLQDAYNRSDVTTEITGGKERARFYTNIGFSTEGSLLDFGEAQNNRNNRINIRGNVDVDLNDFITTSINAAAIFNNNRGVNANYWGEAANLRPHRFSPFVPVNRIEEDDEASQLMVENSNNVIDGEYLLGGNQLHQTHPFGDIYAGGHNKNTSRQFLFDAAVDFDLSGLLDGLTFRSQFGVDYSASYNQGYNNEYAVYDATWNAYSGEDLIGSLEKYGEDAKTGIQNISDSWYEQTLAFSGQFNYNTTLNDRHNISAMLVAHGFQLSETEVYHRTSNANIGLHAGYSFENKYYASFDGSMIHSAKLPEENRSAFSPTFSLGWRLSEEGFLSDSPVVDYLKLTASAGILHTDLDISDYFLYESVYTQTDGSWYSWRDGEVQEQTTDSRRGANPDLSFPKRKEINMGIEASLWKGLLSLDASVFANRMEGLVTQASSIYPMYFSTGWPESSYVPYINYNDDKRMGFDFKVDLNKQLGEVDFTMGIAGTYFETEAAQRDEVYGNDYRKREGRPLDAIFGLESDGFFMDEDEIANSPEQSFGSVQPGDIKYVDQNGDDIIDNKDEVYLGRGGWSGDPLNLGVNLTAKWRNWTFFALGTGGFGAYGMKDNSYYWMSGDDKYSEIARDRWTEETKNTATYPRLTSQSGDNNFRSSDFWRYSTDRFDLTKVQVTYSIPENAFQQSFVQGLDLYISGANLLTISGEKELMELNIGGAPQNRFFNAGIKALF
ncbi:MAG: SusC/RagA family TonB-linked outer membrane protein [Marinilabiliaceae bacterium]